ncbi:MAG TPA: hypothetical protein VNK52_00100 [Hyphomicrobiaceae bacterium]|nr:hypothetical protein [Hyphomicrobiaceae bacterium]
MPTELWGVPVYLAAGVLFLAAAVLIGLLRAGTGSRRAAPARAALRFDLQTISAILGSVSFALQILQWLKVIG